MPECEKRYEELQKTSEDYEDDYDMVWNNILLFKEFSAMGPTSRQDCQDYEFIIDDRVLSVAECLRVLRMLRNRQ